MRAKTIYEFNFKRNIDPMRSMGTGLWANGYYIKRKENHLYEENTLLRGYAIPLSRKSFDPNEVYDEVSANTKIGDLIDTREMSTVLVSARYPFKDSEPFKKILDCLPYVVFKYFYAEDNYEGMFSDWPETFEYDGCFIAEVLDPKSHYNPGKKFHNIYLINAEGYHYARYCTKLKNYKLK